MKWWRRHQIFTNKCFSYHNKLWARRRITYKGDHLYYSREMLPQLDWRRWDSSKTRQSGALNSADQHVIIWISPSFGKSEFIVYCSKITHTAVTSWIWGRYDDSSRIWWWHDDVSLLGQDDYLPPGAAADSLRNKKRQRDMRGLWYNLTIIHH